MPCLPGVDIFVTPSFVFAPVGFSVEVMVLPAAHIGGCFLRYPSGGGLFVTKPFVRISEVLRAWHSWPGAGETDNF